MSVLYPGQMNVQGNRTKYYGPPQPSGAAPVPREAYDFGEDDDDEDEEEIASDEGLFVDTLSPVDRALNEPITEAEQTELRDAAGWKS